MSQSQIKVGEKPAEGTDKVVDNAMNNAMEVTEGNSLSVQQNDLTNMVSSDVTEGLLVSVDKNDCLLSATSDSTNGQQVLITPDSKADSDVHKAEDKSKQIYNTPRAKLVGFVTQGKKSEKKGRSLKKRKQENRSSTGEDSEWEETFSSKKEQNYGSKEELSDIIQEAVSKALTEAMIDTEHRFQHFIETFTTKLNVIEEGVAFRDNEFKDMESTTESIVEKLKETEGRLLRCEKQIADLQDENTALKSRSMSDNIVFYNIIERNDNVHSEYTCALLHGFL